MADEPTPQAVWSGEITIADLCLRVYVLDDGRRIIHAEDFYKLLAWLENPDSMPTEEELRNLSAFQGGFNADR